MKTGNEGKEAPPKRTARIALRPQTEKILEEWKAQLQQLFPAFAPSSSDLVAWIVERTPILSKKEINEIKTLYFDDVAELENLLLHLRKARTQGDETSVSKLLSSVSIRRKATGSPPTPPVLERKDPPTQGP